MYQNYNDISYAESPFGTLNQYMTKTFGWMFAGLLVTFAVAIGAISTGLVYAFINSGVFFITCIAELILVGVLSAVSPACSQAPLLASSLPMRRSTA